MARNEEKHAGRLNRLWLEKLDDENLKKNPPRPGLGSLRTAEEVKKWIPSIKRDIDYYLKQSQVACYPDRKLAEFSSQIEKLSREYKAYLRKYRELKPGEDVVPWTDQPYAKKHKGETSIPPPAEKKSAVDFIPIATPVLQNDNEYSDTYGFDCENTEQDSPESKQSLNMINSVGNHSQSSVNNKNSNTGICTSCKRSRYRWDKKLSGSESQIQESSSTNKNNQRNDSRTCKCLSVHSAESDITKIPDTVLIQGGNEQRDMPLEFNYFKKHRRHVGDVIFSDELQAITETSSVDYIDSLDAGDYLRTNKINQIHLPSVNNSECQSQEVKAMKGDELNEVHVTSFGKVLLHLPYSSDDDSDS